MTELYLGLGSNLGDREANINAALALLETALGCAAKAVSRIIETKSWGFEAHAFLNCVALYELEADVRNPEKEGTEILDICKKIEAQLGRTDAQATKDGVFRSRPIDVDILFYGRERICTPRLTVPHLDMKKRDFVMLPLREIASEDIRREFPEIFGDEDLFSYDC